MSNYDNNMRGTLGVNRRKLEEKHPSHSGSCEIDGRKFWISAWVKTGPDGSKFFSLSFKEKQDQPSQQGQRQAATPHSESKSNGYQPQPGTLVDTAETLGFASDDDIPF